MCGAPRSGTTLLCRALTDFGVGAPDEYFLAEDPAKFPDWGFWEQGPFGDSDGGMSRGDYLTAVYRLGTSSNGVFGAKIMWHNLPWAVAKFQDMPQFAGLDRSDILRSAFPRFHALHVTRRDQVRQAVSWARMTQDGVWVVSETEPASPSGVPRYDFQLIDSLRRLIADAETGWRRFFGELGVTPLDIVYEDDLATPHDLARTVRAIQKFLRLETRVDAVPPAPRTYRQTDSLNDEWVARYVSDLARRP